MKSKVNRTEHHIEVTLHCGYKTTTWIQGMTDSYYISLAENLKSKENEKLLEINKDKAYRCKYKARKRITKA